MAEFAQFVAISGTDQKFVMPDPNASRSFQNIDLDNLDSSRTAVLMFKVRAQGDVRLLMRFNGGSDHDVDFSFSSSELEPFRSFHEVISGSDLQAADNQLFISVSGTGSIQMADVVLLYHAKTS